MCVWEIERKREREREKEKDRKRDGMNIREEIWAKP